MRPTRGLLAAVLGGVVAGAGCCKTCDWCRSCGGGDAPAATAARSGGATAGAVPITATPPVIPAATVAPTAPTGAYGGTGN